MASTTKKNKANKKKEKLEEFLKSKEYKLWEALNETRKNLKLDAGTFTSYKDLGGLYWEPFLQGLVKMAVYFGVNKKIKDVKMNWIRPIKFFGDELTGKIDYDGKHYRIYKGAVNDAASISNEIPSLLNAIEDFEKLTDENENYVKLRNNLKKYIKNFFKNVFNFAVKDKGQTFRELNEKVLKDLLKPLRDLRRAGYRMFLLEKAEERNKQITMFNNKTDFLEFKKCCDEQLFWEKFLLAKQRVENDLNKDSWKEGRETNKKEVTKDLKKENKSDNNFLLDEFISTYLLQQTEQSFVFSDEKRLTPEEEKAAQFRDDKVTKKGKNLSLNNDYYATTTNFHRIDTKKTDKQIKQEEYLNGLEELDYLLKNPNIQNLNIPWANSFRKGVYQVQFEEGIREMLEYLNERDSNRFPQVFNTEKIFVNLRSIPNGLIAPETKFYLEQLKENLEKLKVQSYEMKVNGLARTLLPITLNTEIIDTLKNISDLHIIIDYVMGNYLLYEQYTFFYKKIKFILDSNIYKEISVTKDIDFMERIIPRYIIFESLRHSSIILHKMLIDARDKKEGIYLELTIKQKEVNLERDEKKKAKLEADLNELQEKYNNFNFKKEYFQINEFELEGEINKYFYAYEYSTLINEEEPSKKFTDMEKKSMELKRRYIRELKNFRKISFLEKGIIEKEKTTKFWFNDVDENSTFTDEQKIILETKKRYDKEVEKYGRLWLLEGFFDKNDKDLWYKGIEQLEEINDVVKEDIRDYILNDCSDKKKDELNDSKLSKSSRFTSRSKSKKSKENEKNNLKKKNKGKTGIKSGKVYKSIKKITISSFDSSFEEKYELPENLDNLRPPIVWNFPIQKIKELKNERNLKEFGTSLKEEIRFIDPNPFYEDKRIEVFLNVFNDICNRTMKYWDDKYKIDKVQDLNAENIWIYFFNKVLRVLKINYVPLCRRTKIGNVKDDIECEEI